MREIGLAKFGQNKGLWRKLLQTAPKLPVAASPPNVVLGNGLDAETAAAKPEAEWPGQNLLGRILTEVRDLPAEAHPEEARACADETTGGPARSARPLSACPAVPLLIED